MSEAMRDPREGRLEEAPDGWRLRFERRLPHPPERVWRALTEEEHLAAWFPTTLEGELKPGARLTFRFRGGELRPVTGRLIACEPPRVLEFSWGYDRSELDPAVPADAEILEYFAGVERSRFELEPDGEGCRLTFTTTYDELGRSARDAAGWHVCFDALATHLAGGSGPADPGDPWTPLSRLYAERFGADAATIGAPDRRSD